MRRAASTQKSLTQDLLDLPRREPPSDRNRETLAGVFIDDGQHLEGAPILRALHHEIIRPHMIRILSPPAKTGAIGQPKPPSFGLFLWHLQTLLPPDSLDAFVIDPPAFLMKQGGDPPISVAPLLPGQAHDPAAEGRFLIPVNRHILLGTSALSHHSTRPAFGDRERVLRMADRLSASGRA